MNTPDSQSYSDFSKHQALTVVMTNRCPAQCSHCGTFGGPGNRPALTLPVLTALFDAAQARGYNFVNFTGGEPMILDQLLLDAVAEAYRRDFLVRITTNAYWSPDEGAARARLEPLAVRGLRQLFMSSSDGHLEFVPFDNLLHATAVARSLGIDVLLSVSVTKNSKLNSKSVLEYFRNVHLPPPWIFESPVIPFGRAAENIDENEYMLQDIPIEPTPCKSMKMHPTIQADGLITPCAALFAHECAALDFGNLHEKPFEEIMDEIESNALVNWIHSVGVVALKQTVEQNSDIVLGKRYANICHLCHDILSRQDVLRLLDNLGIGRHSLLQPVCR